MLSAYRREFNARFTRERYLLFLQLLEQRSGAPVKFRNSETPCFFPREMIERMARAGSEMVQQLVSNPEYLAAARERIPAEFVTPNETRRPLFVQADFGIVRDEEGAYAPRLVEIQGFASLYAYQPVLADCYRDAYELSDDLVSLAGDTREDYDEMVRAAILGGHDPEEVVLLEIDPANQKTYPDFLLTQRLCGIRIVDVRDVRRKGSKLFADGQPIRRIYNRVIADEMIRLGIESDFRFADDLDVEWAGHPNWFFLISKFSLPFLRHETVPESWFLDQMPEPPGDLSQFVLKPLFSFAGTGVRVGVTQAELDAIPMALRRNYLLQRRVAFESVIMTPFGPTQAEVRIMYIWGSELTPVTTIVRMGRGRMMGVDHNRDLEWVGASAGFFPRA